MDQPLLRHVDAELPLDLSPEVVASPLVARTHFAAGAPHGSHGDPHPGLRGIDGGKHIRGHSDPERPEPEGALGSRAARLDLTLRFRSRCWRKVGGIRPVHAKRKEKLVARKEKPSALDGLTKFLVVWLREISPLEKQDLDQRPGKEIHHPLGGIRKGGSDKKHVTSRLLLSGLSLSIYIYIYTCLCKYIHIYIYIQYIYTDIVVLHEVRTPIAIYVVKHFTNEIGTPDPN